MISRRSLLTGLGIATIAAPAVVRSGILMPIKKLIVPTTDELALAQTLIESMAQPIEITDVEWRYGQRLMLIKYTSDRWKIEHLDIAWQATTLDPVSQIG